MQKHWIKAINMRTGWCGVVCSMYFICCYYFAVAVAGFAHQSHPISTNLTRESPALRSLALSSHHLLLLCVISPALSSSFLLLLHHSSFLRSSSRHDRGTQSQPFFHQLQPQDHLHCAATIDSRPFVLRVWESGKHILPATPLSTCKLDARLLQPLIVLCLVPSLLLYQSTYILRAR